MTQANPHPTPILLENYGHITPDTTLHEMLSHLVDVASVLGRDGVLPQSPYTPAAERISHDIAARLITWVRDTQPLCGAPADNYRCELQAFHNGNHQDDNAEWP